MIRITVVDEDAESVLFELAAPPSVVARLAPQALADALGDVSSEPAPGPDVVTEPDAAGQPKRRRRTKEEMAAARAAESAADTVEPPVTADVPPAPYNPFA